MKTVTVCIGNSDNKLGQREWAAFVKAVDTVVDNIAYEKFFRGFSNPDDQHQNACWVLSIDDQRPSKLLEDFKRQIAVKRGMFNQDSAAIVIGETEFI